MLLVNYAIGQDQVISVMRDWAAVNGAVEKNNKLLDIGCFTHTMDRVGEHFKTPILSEFFLLPGSCCSPVFPFISATDDLKNELAAHLAKSDGVDPAVNGGSMQPHSLYGQLQPRKCL